MTTGRPIHRFSAKKRVIAPLGVMATAAACLAVAMPAQATDEAEPCVPSAATSDTPGAWAWSRFTGPQSTPTAPADPDHAVGEDNIANVIQIGEPYTEQAPASSISETSAWVKEAPDGDGWTKIDHRIVTDKDAIDTTVSEAVDQWWHWNPGDAGGVQDPSGNPPTPGWNTDNGQHNGIPAPPNRPYNTSQNDNGNSSWFFHEVKDKVVEHHAAVTHEEFKFKRVIETPGHTEYYWSVYTRTVTLGKPAVECPPVTPVDPHVDPGTPVDQVDPATPGNQDEPSTVVEPGTVVESDNPGYAQAESESDEPKTPARADEPKAPAGEAKPTPHGRPADRPAALPLSIDAGL